MFIDWNQFDLNLSVDVEVLKQLDEYDADGTGGFVRDVLSTYVTNTRVAIERIKTAAEKQSFKETFLFSHNLKSSSSNVGAHHLASLCKDLEKKAHDEDGSLMQELIDEIKVEAARVLADSELLLSESSQLRKNLQGNLTA